MNFRISRRQASIGVAALLLSALVSSWLYALMLAVGAAVCMALLRFLRPGGARVWIIGGVMVLYLIALGLAVKPSPSAARQLAPAAAEPGLQIPMGVLEHPNNLGVWLSWAQANSLTSETDTGVVALDQGLLAHPGDQPAYAADLAAVYAELANGQNSWAESLIARYYGIEGHVTPAAPIVPLP